MTSVPTEAIASSDPRRAAHGAFALVRTGLSEVFGRRRLTRYLVGADIKRTHADTLLGQLWWVIDPLLQMAVYIVLVTIIFQPPDTRLPAVHLRGHPALEVVHDDAQRRDALGDRPAEPDPPDPVPEDRPAVGVGHRRDGGASSSVSSPSASSTCSTCDRSRCGCCLMPVIAAVQFLFTMASAILLSALNAFFRDIQNVLRHFLRLWFYLSPGLYSLGRPRQGTPSDSTRCSRSIRSPCCSTRIGR